MKRFYAFIFSILVFLALPVVAFAANSDEVTNTKNLTDHIPTPEQWQAEVIILLPLLIAFAVRTIQSFMNHPMTKNNKKTVAGIFVVAATVIGMLLQHQLDDFTPTLSGFVYLFIGVHNSYDKLWQSIPGLQQIIVKIDPTAGES